MARFREYSYYQTVLIPVAFERQLQPGSFEYAINYLVDTCIDRSTSNRSGDSVKDRAIRLFPEYYFESNYCQSM